MKNFDRQNLIYIGLALILVGIIIPLLEVMQYITSTLFLNFFAYTASTLGLFLGIIGMAYMVSKRKRDK
jgi:hypothetical protein